MAVQDPIILIVHGGTKQLIVLQNITHVTELGGQTIFHTVSDKNDDITIPLSWSDIRTQVNSKIGRYPNLRFLVELD